ncbi:MAG: hypothetical protein JNL28_04260 [Planctomycetes bacterium]|nr:hypothetical protein [Planctomycetota bacterium]
MIQFSSITLACVTFASLALSAGANSLDVPGSLLIYPLFDNNRGGVYTITVTNTNGDSTPLPGGQLLAGTVDVEFVYIHGLNCLEFNRTRRLTPNDTLTVTTIQDNPNQSTGYVYVFAKSPTTGKAIKFDWLAGDSFQTAPTLVGGIDISPVVFLAGSGLAAGANTDVDNDGVRDLNGNEYEKVNDKLLVPRFIADFDGSSRPELILIGLTGQSFQTIVNFLIYNDNEEVFSAQYTFDCWNRIDLRAVNGAFTQEFLQSTNHNPNEFLRVSNVFGPMLVPMQLEYGWFRMDGAVAFSTAASVQDPAFLALRIERFAFTAFAGASLPYGIGVQANGDLVQHGPFPDSN